MTRAELIAKLEAAEGPSRELDAEIDILALESGWREERYMTPDTTPHYTSSIDAALTLVPEGLRWRVSYVPVHQFASASVADGSILSPNTKEWEGKHTTPASALCIAALKAGEKG